MGLVPPNKMRSSKLIGLNAMDEYYDDEEEETPPPPKFEKFRPKPKDKDRRHKKSLSDHRKEDQDF